MLVRLSGAALLLVLTACTERAATPRPPAPVQRVVRLHVVKSSSTSVQGRAGPLSLGAGLGQRTAHLVEQSLAVAGGGVVQIGGEF